MHYYTILFSLIVFAILKNAGASKIVIVTVPVGGHVTEAAELGQGLVKQGHEAYVMLSNLVDPSRFEGKGLKLIPYTSVENPEKENFPASIEEVTRSSEEMCKSFRPIWRQDCNNMVNNPTIIQRWKKEKFDLAIIDGLILCYYILPHNLGIPYVTSTSFVYIKNFNLNPLVYAWPCDIQAEGGTIMGRYHHLQRVKEMEMTGDWLLDESEFLNATAERPYKSLGELQGKSALIIYNQNPILDCPIPVPPNMLLAGGMGAKPPKPLTGKLKEIYDDAKHGVIVMTLGSVVADMPDNILSKFLNVFKKLDQKIVWRFIPRKGSKITSLPNNVYTSSWLPQNDLLGNTKTKLFITHGGNNGQTEGVYNGVPILTMPLFGDQPYNARRATHKNWGLSLKILEFAEDELEKTIKELITNPKYKNSIMSASKRFKYYLNKEDIHKKIATAINELLKFGTDHMTSNIQKLGYYEQLQWDFLVIILGLSMACFFSLFFMLWSCFCRKHSSERIKTE